MRITESQLRQIIREERARLAPRARKLREGRFSYRAKLDLIEDAIDLLGQAQALEALRSEDAIDTDLNGLIEELESYADAVRDMAADEDVPAEPFITMRDPRAMRH
jgi:hypothetical protein